ncbi:MULTISPECIES: lytic transglycosylase domain-containing protein [Halocynthiibacter]|uniref:Lytic transglycosylase domain-containing protein n=1 Tax=Halocynthiibacter halioticoli TaxID=2986804 RepID=A0AAE3LQ87_9RHOB|nr:MULTISPECIES: lytic transglycosylase domain-containing protein [Halocynthiibacter]MCV6823274.1 lytic transglycosylase domain-containing protein [Halocynthiibacter halioticoli]MCW4056275.1 lytic transglycosylase domain-containing protein [Halocynthiibacter sp. SDUM655004]
MLRALRILIFAALVSVTSFVAAKAQTQQQGEALARAMDLVRAQDWDGATAEARKAGKIGAAVVEWHRLRAGEGAFSEYQSFLAVYPDWPGLDYLRKFGESSLPREGAEGQIIGYFVQKLPQTGTGALALSRALRSGGDGDAADALIVDAWRKMSMTKEEQALFLANFGKLLAPHHEARLDMLLWRGLSGEATAMLPYVEDGWQKLAKARITLRKLGQGVDSFIAAVPARLADDPGLAYERFVWRARKDRYPDAIELIKERSVSAEFLGQPEDWARRRAILARWEMRAGRYASAYEVAANHYLTEGSHYIDLEWLAGYISLRYLNKPSRAVTHFRNLEAAVDTPISLGRAFYWQGRAHEAMAEPEKAQAAYQRGGAYQTSFYGQLAAEKAGMAMDPALLGTEPFPNWQNTNIANSTVFQAGLLLHAAREGRLTARFMSHLAETLPREERGALAAWAMAIDNPYVALHVAKRSVQYGDTLHSAYYPMHPVHQMQGLPVRPELALAIARRESEFNPRVISGAGARGLMQVMPGTASDVSKKLGIGYDKSKLTGDWRYNAKLGTAYLDGLNKRFDGNVILVAAGYNAGPGRPNRWLKEFGDPRNSTEAMIDWIEHIPFTETRNYVMRVSEALLPYRAQLAGQAVPLQLSKDIIQR